MCILSSVLDELASCFCLLASDVRELTCSQWGLFVLRSTRSQTGGLPKETRWLLFLRSCDVTLWTMAWALEMGSPLHGSGAQLNLSASSVSAVLHLESLHQQALGFRVTRATKGDCSPCSSSELCQGSHLASYSPVHGERKPGNSRLLPFCVFVCASLFVPFQYFSKSSSAFISDSHCLRDYARKS